MDDDDGETVHEARKAWLKRLEEDVLPDDEIGAEIFHGWNRWYKDKD